MKARGLFLGLVLLCGTARTVQAYCGATSCDPGAPAQHCQVDPKTQCVLSGKPLFWASSCVTFSIQKDAAPRTGIDYGAAKASLARALDAWTQASCGGQQPSIMAQISEPVSCNDSEYNRDHHNANIVIFREDSWPYEGSEDALGLTRVRFDAEQQVGELWDTDIEINAVDEPLSIGMPTKTQVDLDSLMTHEVGHALGLAHSIDLGATMIAGYAKGSIELRDLGSDDVAGICHLYPPTRAASSSSCEPRHGFSELCAAEQPPEDETTSEPAGKSSGCGISLAPHGSGLTALGALSLAAIALFRRRKTDAASTRGGDSV